MTNDVDARDAQRVAFDGGVTPAQYNFLLKLTREKAIPDYDTADERVTAMEERILASRPDRRDVSRWIDKLMKLSTATTLEAERLTRPGVFRVDGQLYVVKPNKKGDRLYAKRLIEIGGERVTESDDVVNFDFVYAPGAIYQIREHHRVTQKEAQDLAIRYGKCINCKRKLKAAKSVLAGYGPVCIKAFAA